jgi:hypothetical protein
VIFFQFGEGLSLTLIANNKSNENRTLTVAGTLVRVNPIEPPESTLEEHNQTSNYDGYGSQNIRNSGSQTSIQSFVQDFDLDPNHRE